MLPDDADPRRTTPDQPPATVPSPDAGSPPSDGPLPETPTSRYRPLHLHAKGGLGEVYLALDEECHREVALKTIQTEWAADEASRERFLREAEITARLEHPSIVPVYGMVVGGDSRPCYAMRFVAGETLYDAVLRIQATNKAKNAPVQGAGPVRQLLAWLSTANQRQLKSAESALANRQLLAHFIAVCNAVAYAHSRGIIHRDLKPQNVMLGKFGETLVVDWGLARVFGRSPAERATGEDSLVPAGQKAQDLTRSGQVVGTPAYMSPEQAAGRLDELGPASDIYSLGATLYFLLTGQAPIREPNVQLLLARVQAGEILPPRKVKQSVPPGLDAICRKAMALRPGDRYATAQELAGDVSRWLADEPVMGWREPLGERFQRLTRKHAASAAGLGAGLFLMIPLINIAIQHYTRSYESLNAMRDTTAAVQAKAQAEIKVSQLERELVNLRGEAERKKIEAQRKKFEADLIKSRYQARLSRIAWAYSRASEKLGRPPKGPEELGPFVEADEDRLSPRDGKPFAIAWGVDCNLLAPNQTLLVWEETPDEEGRRWVFQGNARFVDRCEFRDLTQGAGPGAGASIKASLPQVPPEIPIVLPLVEPTEANGYKVQVRYATTYDRKAFQVFVQLSKAGKTLDLSAGELQARLLAEGNKPLPPKGRWPDPAKPVGAGEKPHITVVADGRVTADYEFVFGRTVPREKLVALELTIKGKQQRLVIPALQGSGKK